MHCKYCGAIIDDDSIHCFQCGKNLKPQEDNNKSNILVNCKNCGVILPAFARFCKKCGSIVGMEEEGTHDENGKTSKADNNYSKELKSENKNSIQEENPGKKDYAKTPLITKFILIFEISMLAFSLFFLLISLKVFLAIFLMGSCIIFFIFTITSLSSKNLRSSFWLPFSFMVFLMSLFVFIIIMNINFGLLETNETTHYKESIAIDEYSDEESEEADSESIKPDEKIKQETLKTDQKEITYKIIYSLEDLRYDDAITYYVLIDPVDISNDSFKNDIKKLISSIAEDKGKKLSLEIYDNSDALEQGYKYERADPEEWQKMASDDEIMTKITRHCIATFDGELETGFYYNTIWFFSYSDGTYVKEIDNYNDIVQYNP